ncbi:MAG: DUF4177 domain-containing protein [Cytophagales bacterium]|nr:DUF4177 domain-containing protein [Armatimonadota bacterium]
MAAKFEYKIVTSTDSDEDDETMLNDLGEDGYELVSVHVSEVTYVETGDGDSDADAESGEEGGEEYVEEVVTYYFKREKE